MNDQNQNNTSNSNERIDVVDANLLNPFQNSGSNINNNSNMSTSNESMINNIQSVNNSITSELNNNNYVKDDLIQAQNNMNNQSNSTLSSSNISTNNNISNLSTSENNIVNNNSSLNNNINKSINSSVSTNNLMPNITNNQSQISSSVPSINSNNSSTSVSGEPSSVIFLVLALASIFGFFGNGIIPVIGVALCIISLIGSIAMIKKNAKLSKLSLIISVIILIIYILTFVLAYKTVDNQIDQVKSSLFKNNASNFAMGARQNVLVNRKISCDGSSLKSVKESLPELANDGQVSPFGGNYDYNASYVLVEANEVNGRCQYDASIYLTDGTYSIGTPSNPVLESDINSTNIKKN